MRQPYDFTYPRPWSESLQTGDSDELIIPLSCNYPPPHSLSLSLLILLFPSQSLLSFVCSLYISFSRLNLSPCLMLSPPSFHYIQTFMITPNLCYRCSFFFVYIVLCVYQICFFFQRAMEEILADCRNENTVCASHGLYR